MPQLKEVPERLLRKMPLSAMFQLNTALAKERKSSEKLGVNSNLAKNSKKLVKNPIIVERGKATGRMFCIPPVLRRRKQRPL